MTCIFTVRPPHSLLTFLCIPCKPPMIKVSDKWLIIKRVGKAWVLLAPEPRETHSWPAGRSRLPWCRWPGSSRSRCPRGSRSWVKERRVSAPSSPAWPPCRLASTGPRPSGSIPWPGTSPPAEVAPADTHSRWPSCGWPSRRRTEASGKYEGPGGGRLGGIKLEQLHSNQKGNLSWVCWGVGRGSSS